MTLNTTKLSKPQKQPSNVLVFLPVKDSKKLNGDCRLISDSLPRPILGRLRTSYEKQDRVTEVEGRGVRESNNITET